jgi:hypothetical protein
MDIINHVGDLYFVDYLRTCPLQYMEILVEKGLDINHVFNLSKYMSGQTVFGSILYDYLSTDRNHVRDRIDKLISLGANVNIGNPIRYVTGIQYENRPYRIEKIKYLQSKGVDFSNCSSDKDSNHETRLGKLIQLLHQNATKP